MLVKRIAACSHASIVNRFPVIQPVSSKVRHFGTFFAHMASPGYAPGTITIMLYMDGKRIQCWSNALQHIPICLQPFTSYRSEIATFSCSLAFNAPVGVFPYPIGITKKSLVDRLRAVGRKLQLFPAPLHLTPPLGVFPYPIGITKKSLVLSKLELWGYQAVKTV